MDIFIGIILPFIGTCIGSMLVFFVDNKLNSKIQRILLGFASGVMIAAAIWSLIIPAIEKSSNLKALSFLPASIGFLFGIVFLLILDIIIPHLHKASGKAEGIKSKLKNQTMLVFAVTLHNIPEGLAVGVVLAGAYYGNGFLTFAAAVSLSIGIAIQNVPEGAIISMPLKSNGMTKFKSFMIGVLSGVVEPIFAGIAFMLSIIVNPILPYVLAFAAGAMIYVVVEDLIPSSQQEEHCNLATIFFALGFILMMALDVALG